MLSRFTLQIVSREKTYKLEELATEAGVSPRTVRYYVQRGLLPAPEFRGRDTVYDEEHVVRLRAIRRLQERHLPLDAIQAELARRTAAELERLPPAASPVPVPLPRPLPRAESLQRLVLAPGVELLVSEGARVGEALVDEVKAIIERHMKGRST
jgi:DNA-binding transcriptional MerR regulator